MVKIKLHHKLIFLFFLLFVVAAINNSCLANEKVRHIQAEESPINNINPTQKNKSLVNLSSTSSAKSDLIYNTYNKSHETSSNLFEFNPLILVSQLINFIILLYILNRFFFTKISELLSEREKTINEQISTASLKLSEANQLKKEFEEKLANFMQICYEEKQKVLKEAYEMQEKIIENAKIEAENIINNAHRLIQLEKEKSWIEIRDKIIQITKLSTEKVISLVIDDKIHHDLIKKTIQEVELELDTKEK